jgi:hypothetical protein
MPPLASRGETTQGLLMHAWVSALDARTRKALGQYLRLRRHRLHAPKVALEITAAVHATLSEYAVKVGSLSPGRGHRIAPLRTSLDCGSVSIIRGDSSSAGGSGGARQGDGRVWRR